MVILHILEPFASGVATAVSAIICELSDFEHIVIHGCRNWTENTENVKKRFPANVSFIEWKYVDRNINLIKDWKALKELKTILKAYIHKKIPFVVHLHSSKAGFLGRYACCLLGIKTVIYTPHGGAFLRTDISLLKRKFFYFLEWLGSCFGGMVVGCGPSEGMLYKKMKKNTTYVSNGVAPKKENNTTDRNLITFVGIASQQKAPDFWNVVTSVSAEFAKDKGFSFTWVGDGPKANELTCKHINLTGWASAKEVEELLEKTSIYFSTSAWEGLPFGVLEAMNCGCALLLRDVPGHRELVIPGENGWLFKTEKEAEEYLNMMVKDRSLLSAMGKRSLEIIQQQYTLEQMGNGYKQIYSSF